MPQKNPTETRYTTTVVELARVLGWRVSHFRPARTATGWRTAVQGDAGFPDLVMAKGGVVIFAELKTANGRVSPAQRDWLDALDRCPGVRTFLWVVPDQFDEIEEVLRGQK